MRRKDSRYNLPSFHFSTTRFTSYFTIICRKLIICIKPEAMLVSHFITSPGTLFDSLFPVPTFISRHTSVAYMVQYSFTTEVSNPQLLYNHAVYVQFHRFSRVKNVTHQFRYTKNSKIRKSCVSGNHDELAKRTHNEYNNDIK
jgi:hypothetical protein